MVSLQIIGVFLTLCQPIFGYRPIQLSRQPKILVRNGELTFDVPHNKNVTFVTSGSGSVLLNGIDLAAVARQAKNATDMVKRHGSNLEDSFLKVDEVYQSVYGNRGLMQRVRNLELGGGNRTYGFTPLSVRRQINNLTRNIRQLQNSLTTLTTLLETNECTSNPCRNGGTCIDLYNGFHCLCPKNWEGPSCDVDVDECRELIGTDLGCQNGASCRNWPPGSFTCDCAPGWHGMRCTSRDTDCSTHGRQLCGEHGTCVQQNTNVGYTCICDPGWYFNKDTSRCEDVDECKSQRHCDPRVACYNTPGSFTCGQCPPGFTGDGFSCEDIDECVINNGGCSLVPRAECRNTIGSRVCGSCPAGYSGNGEICIYVGSSCNVNNGGCHSIAECRYDPVSLTVRCVCPSGYTGHGRGKDGCEITYGACLTSPCNNGAVCSESSHAPGGYICQCAPGYSGKNCNTVGNLCERNPCMNGGTCQETGNVVKCVCPSTFSGPLCQWRRQFCGGRFTNPQGTIKFPLDTLVSDTSRTHSCPWVIETTVGKVLTLNFTKFNLESSKSCVHDWLEIHEGAHTGETSLGRFCGSNPPFNGSVTTTDNKVYIWFRSDHSMDGSHFEILWNTTDPVCGGSLSVTSSGRISSPGAPAKYPNNRDCYWRLVTQPNKRILFTFFSVDFGPDDPLCSHDYIEFTSGSSEHGNTFYKYCNQSLPGPLHSIGSEVVVHFHSDNSDNYAGFQLSYAVEEGMPGCGGVFTHSEGELHPPTVNNKYQHSVYCEYLIRVLPESRVRLSFLDFDLEGSEDCEYDSLKIYQGATTSSPLVGTYCGDNDPAPYLFPTNEILVVFQTDFSNNGRGFVIKYESVCGGIYRNASGIIESPGYPSPSTEEVNCIYEITTAPGTAIKLHFIDLKRSDTYYYYDNNCQYMDYLELHDGADENSTLVGQYCTKTPPDMLSTYNYIFLKYHADNFERGFQANYSTVDTGCGGIFKDPNGTISHPSNRERYLADSFCQWAIVAPPLKNILIKFITFELEGSQDDCEYDYVNIYENSTDFTLSGKLGTYCGETLPPEIMSSTNMVTITFTSDYSIERGGFTLGYEFVPGSRCGGNKYASVGVITSPGYPQNYPTNSQQCEWVIIAEPGQQVMLNISDFYLEETDEACSYDFLEIRNGGNRDSPLVGKYCGDGKIPKKIFSHTNKMYILFKTDETISERGFKITWNSASRGCGGTLSGASGEIMSPNYPQPYVKDTECHWRIAASAGSRIKVHFDEIDLEESDTCSLDYVQLFDGTSILSKPLGKYCKPNTTEIISSLNHMSVRFVSDISYAGRGFSLKYETECTNTVKGFYGVIESPNYPEAYMADSDCVWTIEVSRKNKINITFTAFEIEGILYYEASEKCGYDYLQIEYIDLDGTNQSTLNYKKQGRYCGSDIPEPMTLDGNNAKIHFVTDVNQQYSGFRLEWQIFGCGDKLTRPEGTFQSPNYPHGYSAYVQCNWIIEVEYGHKIILKFDDIDLEITPNCTADFIKVYNGPDETYPLFATLCHQTNASIITSTGNAVFIDFQADSGHHGKGFTASYSTNNTKCGGRFTTPQGILTSPNYPNEYDTGEICGWLIEVEPGHTVDLEFEDVDLTKGGMACDVDYIKIYDGGSIDYPELMKICEDKKPNSSIVSTSNSMFVQLRTHDWLTAKGFKAKYFTGCGARIIVNESGSIDYTEKNLYSSRQEKCSWIITAADPSKHIYLSFGHVRENFGCKPNTGIVISFGESLSANHTYCMADLPATIVSPGNVIHIEVNIHIHELFATFTVMESTCGGVLSSLEGVFASPGYPDEYPFDKTCEWNLDMAEGNRLTLQFNVFELLDSPNCNSDFLEIRKDNSSGTLLGTYCGNNPPTNLTGEGNLYLLLKTSSTGTGTVTAFRGFSAFYQLEHESNLRGPRGIIESPMYPRKYHGLGEYRWRITVTFGHKIVVNFLDIYMESEFSGDLCLYVDLQIYDGYDTTAPRIGTYCGFTIPENVTSTSNVLFITMKSDSIRVESKFKLEWLEVANIPKTGEQKGNKTCGSDSPIDISLSQNYTLKSPGYPNGYAVNLVCEWIFSTTENNHLEVDLNELDLDYAYHNRYEYQNCYNDRLEIFEGVGDTQNWKQEYKVCTPNATTRYLQLKSNLVKFRFVSNSYSNGTGFEALIWEDCGGTLRQPSGKIIFDNTTSHMNNYMCQWNVTVRSGRTIKVSFPFFDVGGSSSDCATEYVMLRNGQYPDSPYLDKGIFCGKEPPSEMQTTSNYLYVKYKGYRSIKGFHLKYQEVSYSCGETVTLDAFANSTEITSPNYPNVPPSHIECSWIINAPPGEALRIDFEGKFEFRSNSQCSDEYVELRDGGTKFSRFIGRFCEQAPNSQYTSGNVAHITYFTETDSPEAGFKAKVSIASCGGTIHEEKGEIKSPFFQAKHLYPRKAHCEWKLLQPPNYHFMLKFDVLDLPWVSDCTSGDRISIYEKRNGELTKYRDICGQGNLETEYIVLSNEVHILFEANNDGYYLDGFKLAFNSSYKQCGEEIQAPFGEIITPNYPHISAEPLHCMWIIEVPKGRRVTLEIEDVDLEFRSYEQDIHFYNDKDYASLIGSASGDAFNKTIKSTDNIMMVALNYLGGEGHKGLKATFSSAEPSVCIGDFTGESGTLARPLDNMTAYACFWKRNVDLLSTSLTSTLAMNIDVTASDIDSYTCEYEIYFLVITGGDKEQIIKGYCFGGKFTDIVRTPLPVTEIETFKASSTQVSNLTINYKTYQCGGVIKGETGYIVSPQFSHDASQGAECSWIIEVPTEQTIKLDFKYFDLDSNCERNYVVIYNGNLPTAPRIGKFCNKETPATIRSQTNSLWIDYHVERNVVSRGFNISYEPLIDGCGGIYHDSNRIIQTPNYPKDYAKNVECVWEVRAPEGFFISFEFIDRFFIETSEECKDDYAEIFDKTNNEWKSLGKKCGRELKKKAFNSTSNEIKIMFRSDGNSNVGTGFKAQWTFLCGGQFNADATRRYINSPNYPQNYGSNLDCVYTINSTSPGKTINLVFEDFLLEGEKPSCQYDKLRIIVSTSNYYLPSTQISYCGDNKPPAIRLLDSFLITFTTDGSRFYKGFRFWYQIEQCGGNITEPTTITSLKLETQQNNFDNGYVRTAECEWRIVAPSNQIIVLRAEEVKLKFFPPCSTYNGIATYDGLKEDSKHLLTIFCGSGSNGFSTLHSKTNQMLVKSQRRFTDTTEYFKFDVFFSYAPSAGCGGQINLTSEQIIQSPNLNDIDCAWIFTGQPGKSIKIKFTEFNLKSNCSWHKYSNQTDCPCSFVELRDGPTLNSELIQRICSNISSSVIQKEFITSDVHAYLRVSSQGENHNAFKATVSLEPSVCGELVLNVTNEPQALTSPGYPSPYPSNRKCVWRLKSQSVSNIHLHFVDLDLNEENGQHVIDNKCGQDVLQIMDQGANYYSYLYQSSELGTRNGIIMDDNGFVVSKNEFCGKDDRPFDFYPMGQSISVSFTSGLSTNKGRGFKLMYQKANCSRSYTSPNERIRLIAPEFGDCTIDIKIQDNATISLYFSQFSSSVSDNCTDTGIEVKEGTSDGKTLVRTCGYAKPNPIFSTANRLFVHIWLKVKERYFSIDMMYTSTTAGPGCGGTFYNKEGTFTSPMYPTDYRNDSLCTWEIRVPIGLKALLTFKTFDIQAACRENYVSVITYDGDTQNEHKFCKSDNPAMLLSGNSKMTVKYKASRNNGGAGWLAEFVGVDSGWEMKSGNEDPFPYRHMNYGRLG